ncbi:conserved hypothetical protein [Frankia canadensis]|uniref:Uncharacterized protein n=1 Tax=Frankia canadensis TaxID=1836972 RepID=A0A2I2KQG9_9ACTN|nr:hypothetical protein [Frankia canadensis]SNQ47912.1 conserved hypothetical protein [Frankia canadensis]SOU55202.1 conserved hypothetical protein [Frankia canadensis]
MPRRFVARDGQPLCLDHWHPHEAFHQFFVEPPPIETFMRDAGVAAPPAIPAWPAAASTATPDLDENGPAEPAA